MIIIHDGSRHHNGFLKSLNTGFHGSGGGRCIIMPNFVNQLTQVDSVRGWKWILHIWHHNLTNELPLQIELIKKGQYSWISLYRTRLIRTSTYIDVGLWFQPPAIVSYRREKRRIYWTRLYKSLSYIKHAAPQLRVHAAVYIEVNHIKLCS